MAIKPVTTQRVALRTWALQKWGAKKQDQAAGFIFWAEREGHTHFSSPEWQQLYEKFQKTPAGKQ